MSLDDPEALGRFESHLSTLRQLKETSARREMQERDTLLSVLLLNRQRIAEFPTLEAEQHNLVATLTQRADQLPAFDYFRDWLSGFLVTLNQYEVAKRTGADDQIAHLETQLHNQETLLVKCLQGSIWTSGVIRDEFNDIILYRFGEGALADLDELTHSGESDERYWQGLLERFIFGFVNKTYGELVTDDKYKLTREGSFLALRFPLDALLARMPGTDKSIDKTRLQAAFDQTLADPELLKSAQALSAVIFSLDPPLLSGKIKADLDFIGRVASMDPSAGLYLQALAEEAVAGELSKDEASARFAQAQFLRDQVLAVATGAALSLGVSRESLSKGLKVFTPREQETLLAVCGAFHPESLSVAFTLMLEYALTRLLTDRGADEGGKVQVKCVKQRRAPRARVEALTTKGLNRIRLKLFFEEDPANPAWFLFKAKTAQELAETLNMANDPRLVPALQTLWTHMDFKVEAVVLINLPLVAKSTPNIQAKVGEILRKYGVVKTASS